jgi:hypothetical protein
MSLEVPPVPAYLHLERHERASNLHLDHSTYSLLASTALAVVRDIPHHFMAVYCLSDARGCCLDIFAHAQCLSILIDAKENQLALLLCEDLDSPRPPVCLLSIGNSKAGWSQRKEMAKAQLSN